MAVIAYSTRPQIVFNFKNSDGSYYTATEARRLLGLMKWQRGFTYIDRALALAEKDVFIEKAGMRKDMTKVCL